MKVFHYMRVPVWQQAQKEGRISPQRILGRDDMEAWSTRATFCLLEAKPESWTKNPIFPTSWEWLRSHVGPVLTEIDMDIDSEGMFVVDRGYMEGFYFNDKTGITPPYLSQTQREAEQKYVKSKIPLKDYLERQAEPGYSLPEVIITKDISLETIRISEQQPLIEETLRWNAEHLIKTAQDEFVDEVRAVPEIKEWFNRHAGETEVRLPSETR